jgi:predicted transcriptional regulator
MDVMWTSPAPLTVRQVAEALASSRSVAYTTVLTVMDNLFRKDVLARELEGRAHVYRPRTSREEFAADLVESALSDSPDPAAVLIRFADRLGEADVRRLAEALERHRGRTTRNVAGDPRP